MDVIGRVRRLARLDGELGRVWTNVVEAASSWRHRLARSSQSIDTGRLTDEDIAAFAASVRELLDEDARAGAWRR